MRMILDYEDPHRKVVARGKVHAPRTSGSFCGRRVLWRPVHQISSPVLLAEHIESRGGSATRRIDSGRYRRDILPDVPIRSCRVTIQDMDPACPELRLPAEQTTFGRPSDEYPSDGIGAPTESR